MKKLLIIANWKSNKTIKDGEKWLHSFGEELKSEKFSNNKEIIIAPSFTLFEHLHYCVNNLNLMIKFAAQDISPFDEGAYTGEVNGRQIKEFADYVLIGHSERRKNFVESKDLINLKISKAFKCGLTPIVCVSSLEQAKTLQEIIGGNSQFIVAYEPLFAIGSGIADTPENADQMARSIKDILGDIPVLYGGSVTSKDIGEFSKSSNIDGVLVGKASLNPLEFFEIAKNA